MYKCPWIGTFYADEYREEVRVSQQFQQLVVVGHVDRGLGRELERVVALLEPGREFRQECSERLFVADQVVVDEIDVAAVAKLIQSFELGEHLRRRLGTRHTAI